MDAHGCGQGLVEGETRPGDQNVLTWVGQTRDHHFQGTGAATGKYNILRNGIDKGGGHLIIEIYPVVAFS